MEHVVRLDSWFAEVLREVRCSDDTRAYVTGVLAGFKTTQQMLDPSASIVVLFADARRSGEFSAFQRLGDNVLWLGAFCHEAIDDHKLIETIGRSAYFSCYTLLGRRWRCYEELADTLPSIIFDVRRRCRSLLPGVRSVHVAKPAV